MTTPAMPETPATPAPPEGPATRTFGGQSMTAPLREALLKAPGPAFGRAFEDPAHGFLHPVDLDVARREHAAFSELLGSLGTTVHQLEAEIDSPDLLYAYDPLIITDRGAIPLRPGKLNRQIEPAAIEAWTLAHGIPTIGRIEAPGTIEGGDTFCSGRTCSSSAAPCARTTRARASWPRSSAATSGSSTRPTGVATPTCST